MKHVTRLFVIVCLTLIAASATAAVKHWDINGATAGAGGATPAGTWNTATANWTTDSTGSSAATTWAAGDSAVFSAGTDASGAFTVTVSATQTGVGLGIEEGTVSIAGGTITNGASAFAITVASGATLSTDSSLRIRIGTNSTLTINDGTVRTTNPGAAGTFMDEDLAIILNGSCTFSHTTANILNIVQAGTTVSGSGSLTKAGVGVLAFAGPCTYSGSTTVTDGELRIRTTANRLPTGTDVTVTSPGILNLNGVAQQIGSLTGNGNVGLAGATLTIGGTNSPAPYTGAITTTANAGAGGSTATGGNVTKQGTGTLTLAGANDFTGLLTLTAGGINVTDTGSLCGSICDLLVNGGTLSLTNGFQQIENLGGTGGTIILNTGHTLSINPANVNRSSTFSGAIIGPGAIEKVGSRAEYLVGTNTYAGPTAVNAGTLYIGPANATTGSYSVANGARFGATQITPGSSANATDAVFADGGGMGFDFADLGLPTAKLLTLGTLTVNGNSPVNVKGFDNLTGTITLMEYTGARTGAGSFTLGDLPPHTGAVLTDDTANSRVILNITNADTLVWVSDVNGIWDVNNGANQIWQAVPSNVAADYQENSMQSDVVRFDDTATGTTTVNVTTTNSPRKMTVNNSSLSYVFSGAGRISGPVALVKSGSGSLSVALNNNYSGGTILNAGAINIGHNSALGSGKLSINGGAIRSDSATARTLAMPVDLNGDVTLGDSVNTGDLTFSGAWVLTGSRQINVDTINVTNTGSIGDGGGGFGLTKNGTGTLNLTTANTFSGGIVHNAGTLRANNNTAFGVANSPVTLANGVTLSLTALNNRTLTYDWTVNGDITLGQVNTAVITMAGFVDLGGGNQAITTVYTNHTISGIITNGGLIKEGATTLTISSTTNTYAGGTRVNAGTLSINGTATLGSGALIFAGGNMIQSANRTAANALPNDIELLADGVIRGDTTGSGTRAARFSRLIGSGGNLTIANAGTVAGILDLILAGGNYTFTNNVVVGAASESGGAQLSLFNLNTTNPVVYSGIISGYGSVRRSASTTGAGGTAILTSANTYTGGTAINDGTLLVNNTAGSGTGSGQVTVSSDGILGGTGTVSGSVVVVSNGVVNAGTSAGILTLGNGLDLGDNDATNVWELAANSTNNAGVNFDQISLTGGNLVLGGTSRLHVRFIGSATFPDAGNPFWQTNRSWLIIAGSGSAANPGSTTFASVDGVAGNNAGSFSTSADANGNVYLNFTPGVTPPPPVIDSTIVGAGTTSAQVSWSSMAGASYTVEYKSNLNQIGWLTLTNLTASGTTTTIVDNTSPVPVERYYRVVSP